MTKPLPVLLVVVVVGEGLVLGPENCVLQMARKFCGSIHYIFSDSNFFWFFWGGGLKGVQRGNERGGGGAGDRHVLLQACPCPQQQHRPPLSSPQKKVLHPHNTPFTHRPAL